MVTVVGAGVSGLTTAIVLAESGVPTRVLAAEPPQETTSVAAGALWGPSFQQPYDKTLEWTARSLLDFQDLAAEPGTGVRISDVLTVGGGDLPDELPPQVALIPGLRRATPDELPAGYDSGSWGWMPVVDMPTYLDYLTRRLAAAGTRVEQQRVEDLEHAGERVVNCTGVGARELARDDTVRPVFGQHVILDNPGLTHAFMELGRDGEWTSFMAHPTRVVCGGVRIQDRWDRTPDDDITDRILERCRALEPRLADAKVQGVVTGLRPERPAVRVETEQRNQVHVVHNYGHGGTGVSLSWGCAREAARLVVGG
ncbi:amino acid oxidase [Asanoa ishikariensis]|uniref:D-amino-acid oxidase n=1 Tax=Asanoa ishikariensis TaxID=137265 RepID=A0A1H3T538_9ACTN|nr:FAD-dependent oxidoreductase [Asanoa ishikariensis]GIF63007.1 amino acid oxidase [Asanoa ishikariensis]SDZ45150.1 D-amino-acid:oxygen oxidoreductase [Asanoa ishikariensis]